MGKTRSAAAAGLSGDSLNKGFYIAIDDIKVYLPPPFVIPAAQRAAGHHAGGGGGAAGGVATRRWGDAAGRRFVGAGVARRGGRGPRVARQQSRRRPRTVARPPGWLLQGAQFGPARGFLGAGGGR